MKPDKNNCLRSPLIVIITEESHPKYKEQLHYL